MPAVNKSVNCHTSCLWRETTSISCMQVAALKTMLLCKVAPLDRGVAASSKDVRAHHISTSQTLSTLPSLCMETDDMIIHVEVVIIIVFHIRDVCSIESMTYANLEVNIQRFVLSVESYEMHSCLSDCVAAHGGGGGYISTGRVRFHTRVC